MTWYFLISNASWGTVSEAVFALRAMLWKHLKRKGHSMYEEITTAVALIGLCGSICSIAAYAEYRIDKYRLKRRRKKMVQKTKGTGKF